MNIKIAHLYYDLMNLYGDSGNVKALKFYLEKQGVKVSVKLLSIDDEFCLDDYDIIYIGSGTENNQKMVLNHLLKYRTKIDELIENNKFFLITGNAFELFGKEITDMNDSTYKALNIFDYTSKQEKKRKVDEALFKCSLIDDYVIGFQNQSGMACGNFNLFEVIKGIGSNIDNKVEGLHYKNFYGTYLIGPILVRNPKFLNYFIRELISSKNPKFKFKKVNQTFEKKAFENVVKKSVI